MKLGEDVKRIIWIQTGFLGDIILTTAAFHWVRSRYPEVEQWLITTPLGRDALGDHADLDKILVFDKRARSFWAAAKPLRDALHSCHPADTVILQIHRSTRSRLLSLFLRLPTVVYEESSLSSLARWRVPRIALLHETQRILLLLQPLGVARHQFADALPYLTPRLESPLAREIAVWGQGVPMVAIAPGSVWGTKRWPQDSYRQLVQILLKQTDVKLLIIGSREEKAAAEAVSEVAPADRGRLWNLAGKTTLDELRGIYPQVCLLISNDSSPLHYASAFGVLSLAIFGATVPALGFGPLAKGSRVAEIDLPCRPCSDHGPQLCPLSHFNCMKGLKVENVSQIAIEMLALNLAK